MDPFPFNGTIAPGSFPRFVADLYRHGATGSLKVEGTTYRKAIYFRNGRILFGSSNDPRDQLGAILVATGRITEAQVEAESQKVGPGKPLARVLADGGLVGQKELAEAARMKVERILADLLTYSAGTFEFEDGVLPKGAVDLRLSTPRLFLSAARAAGNELPPMVIGPGEQVLRRREGGDAILAELENDASSFARALDSHRAVGSVGSSVGLGTRESERIATGLVLLGLAEHIGAPQIDDAPPPEPFDPFTLLTESSSNLSLDHGGETIRASSLDDLALPLRSREEEVAEQPGLSFEETDKTTIFPPEPIKLDTESDSGPVVKTAFGASTADLGLDRARLKTQLDLPEEKPPELEIRFDPDPEPPKVQVEHAVTPPARVSVTPPARVSEPHERTIRKPPSTVVPPPSTAPPPFLRPEAPIRVARAGRSSVPGLLVALGLIAAAGVALWLWLNTSGREQAVASPEPSAAASPTSEAAPQASAGAATPVPASPVPRRRAAEVLPTPPPPAPRTAAAATPPPQRPRQVVSTGDGALQLLRQGDVAGAARTFAGSTAREGYTIQLLVACSPQTAVKAAEQVTTGDLYVLPVRYQGRDCYRVVFGRYPTEGAASAALERSVPAFFTREGVRPRVESLAEIVP